MDDFDEDRSPDLDPERTYQERRREERLCADLQATNALADEAIAQQRRQEEECEELRAQIKSWKLATREADSARAKGDSQLVAELSRVSRLQEEGVELERQRFLALQSAAHRAGGLPASSVLRLGAYR